jgi:HEAT repeat protein
LNLLIAAEDSNRPGIRANAIEALQETSPRDAADAATKGLTDADPGVRFSACMAVGQLKLASAHQRLLEMHDSDPSPVVQVGVRFALHRLGDTRYSHDLEKFARDSDPEIRGKTALALGLLQEPTAANILNPMRNDSEATVRLQAAASLWLMGDQRGLDDLVVWAISKFPDDLMIATLALAQPKDQSVIQHVRGNLVTDYPEVDLAAARALGMLGSDEGYAIAVLGTKSKDPRQRWLGARALGDIGRTDAQPILSALLKDDDILVRVCAATAILELHDPSQMPTN